MNIKRLERLAAKYLISGAYAFSKMLPVKNKITFASYRSLDLTGNFKYIYEKVKERNLNYEFKFLFEKYNNTLLGKAKYLLHMISAGYHMATSKYFIIDDYYFPVYVIKPRKNTSIIQVWHACGAFKKFGYSVLGREYGASDEYINDIPIHSNYDNVVVSSKEVIPHYADAFNMDSRKVLPIGIPRTDIFFEKDLLEEAKERVYSKFPELRNKTVVLYAPTFRGKGQTTVQFNMNLDLDKISSNLNDDYIFALKMHPFVKNRFTHKANNIIDLSNYYDVNDLLIVADILITDYSSVIFEFSIMEKPIILYAPDKIEYIAERDFYYEYDSFVPGPITKTTREIIDLLNTKNLDTTLVKKFKKKFFDYSDGNSTDRFVDTFIDVI